MRTSEPQRGWAADGKRASHKMYMLFVSNYLVLLWHSRDVECMVSTYKWRLPVKNRGAVVFNLIFCFFFIQEKRKSVIRN